MIRRIQNTRTLKIKINSYNVLIYCSFPQDKPIQDVQKEDDDVARSEATFRYTVQNISQLKEQVLSPPCYVRCLPWKILILIRHTTTPERQQQKALGVFLQCNGDYDTPGWSCYGLGELKLMSHKADGAHLCRKLHHMYHW